MYGTLLHVVTTIVAKKNYNKGREIVLPSRTKAILSRKPVGTLTTLVTYSPLDKM
jgi:hypothetical protein